MVRASMVLLASALLVAPAFVLFATLAKDATDISQPLSSTNVLGSKERPISKVVRMLKDIEDELETSQDDDTAVHDKLACWCDTNRNEKTAAIEQGETNDAQLQAFIGDALAIIQELQVTRKDARDELYVVRLEKRVAELKDQVVTLALTVDVALATNVPQPSHAPKPSHKLKGKPIGKGFNEFMAFFKQAHPGSVYGKAASQVSKLVGEAWQAMNEVQKQPYREQFEQKLQSWATGQASNSSNCN